MIDISPMNDVKYIHEVEVERGRIRFLSNTLGLSAPEYHDVAAARAAGHRDLVMPPTLLVGLELETHAVFDIFRKLKIPLERVLHGSQSATFHDTIHAGDTLVLTTRVSDSFSKKGGGLDFVVRRTEAHRNGVLVAEMEATIVVQNDRELSQ